MADWSYTGHKPNRVVIRSELTGLDGAAGRELDRVSALVLGEARRRVGVRTGTLLTSLRRESGMSGGGAYVEVVAGVRGLTTYLGWHMNGAPPHVIVPRRRRALRFVAGGQVVFARRVRHPGNPGNDFLRDALRAVGG